MFSKKVYCDCCGKIFQRNISHVKNGKQIYMECKERKRTGGFICSNNRSIRYDDLENLVLDQINKQIEKYYDITKVKKDYYSQKIEENIDNSIKILMNEKEKCNIQIAKKQGTLTMLYEDRANGIIDTAEFTLIKNKYSIDVDEYNKRNIQIDEQIEKLKTTKKEEQQKEEIFKKYKKVDKLTKVIIDEFIYRIYIGNIDPKTKKRKFHIIWNINLD